MSRLADRDPKARAGDEESSRRVAVEREGASIALRLAIGKDGLGIELARPAALGCLDVVELVVRLPQVRFPFDVSGGVARFRHRRGELERVAALLDARRVARWAEPLLRGLLGENAHVAIAPRAFGATVTVVATARGGEEPRALAFEIALVASPELAVVVHSARGAHLPGPATALAIRAIARLLGDSARREGARFVVPRAAERLARLLLPDAGVRAPAGPDVALAGSGESDGALFLLFTRGAHDGRGSAVAQPPAAATLAHEAALLTRAADDARVAGDLDRARGLDLASLERAPRHAHVAQRIAELDAVAGGRAEAAIATLRAAERPGYLGLLLGELLAETGDESGAVAALLREGERDPSAPIAALAYGRAARLARNPADALDWLDRAVDRAAPYSALAELRWERATRRIEQGRLADARADFQELEALAEGARERYAMLRRAAEIHRSRGLGVDAALLYERALLYRPDDPDAVAGLGAAIAAEGRAPRGATLLARAIELASAQIPPLPAAWMELELAKVLGDRLDDKPAAVARLRAVADDAREAIAARGLEGRYRAALGDASGASLAFARLRERAGSEPAAVPWLAEAARFEEARGDLVRAQSHLAAALAITPTDANLQTGYRSLGTRLSPTPTPTPAPEPAPALAPPPPPAAPELPSPEEDESRIEALTRTLQGDPTNDAVVDELVLRLTRLGRSMELLALLSARLEDAPPERRAELLPRHREVLDRLEAEARTSGREGEADLFKMAREASE